MNHTHERPIHNKNRRRWRIGAAILMSAALLAVSIVEAAQKQEYQTLTLVREYASKDAFQADNAALLRERRPIVDAGEVIQFLDPETGHVMKQITKGPGVHDIALTDTERRQIADPATRTALTRRCLDYMLPHQGSQAFLLESEHELTFHPPDETGEYDDTRLRTTVYNQRGEPLLELPPETNLIVGSPDGSHFVAYLDDRFTPGEQLYFYQGTGALMKQYPLRYSMLNISYSSNSQYLALYSLVGKHFYIFTRQGELVFQGNYQDYADKNVVLYGAFVSDDGNYILLSTSRKAILLNRHGIKQWEILVPPTPHIRSTYFELHRKLVSISTLVPNKIYDASSGRRDILKIVTLEDGKILDEISNLMYYAIEDGVLQIKQRGGSYYEYRIK